MAIMVNGHIIRGTAQEVFKRWSQLMDETVCNTENPHPVFHMYPVNEKKGKSKDKKDGKEELCAKCAERGRLAQVLKLPYAGPLQGPPEFRSDVVHFDETKEGPPRKNLTRVALVMATA